MMSPVLPQPLLGAFATQPIVKEPIGYCLLRVRARVWPKEGRGRQGARIRGLAEGGRTGVV